MGKVIYPNQFMGQPQTELEAKTAAEDDITLVHDFEKCYQALLFFCSVGGAPIDSLLKVLDFLEDWR